MCGVVAVCGCVWLFVIECGAFVCVVAPRPLALPLRVRIWVEGSIVAPPPLRVRVRVREFVEPEPELVRVRIRVLIRVWVREREVDVCGGLCVWLSLIAVCGCVWLCVMDACTGGCLWCVCVLAVYWQDASSLSGKETHRFF